MKSQKEARTFELAKNDLRFVVDLILDFDWERGQSELPKPNLRSDRRRRSKF